MLVNQFLILGAVLFCIGVYGVHHAQERGAGADEHRAHPQLGQHQPARLRPAERRLSDGNVFALYIIAVAAAEVGVGLAMVLLIFRNRKSISLDDLSEMKG